MSSVNNVAASDVDRIGQLTSVLGSAGKPSKVDTEDVPVPLSLLSETDSLPSLSEAKSKLKLEQLVKLLTDEARKQGVSDAVDQLEIQGEELKAANDEKLEALAEQIDKMKSKSFWSGFLKAFQIIGTVVGMIASIATAAVGVISGNPALVAVGVMGAVFAADGIASLASDGQVSLAAGFTELGKACGMSDADAAIFGGCMSVVIQLAVAALSFGASSASSASNIATSATDTASKALNTISKVSTVTNAVEGVNGVASGVTGAALAVINNKIAKLEAQSLDIDALLEELRAQLARGEAFIEAELKATRELEGQLSDIIESCTDTAAQIVSASPSCA